ncbi:MAG: hypothetical protein R6X08_07495 [Desulfosalsimonadaceae bacterium]
MTKPMIRPDMTLIDIISQYRETETVFKRSGIWDGIWGRNLGSDQGKTLK